MAKKVEPGTGGEVYVPYKERTGNESIVYFTRDLSPKGLRKMYKKVSGNMQGKIAVKLHTGEPKGPNIIPVKWVKELIRREIPEATIVETNTLYEGGRTTTEKHRETLAVNGWDFCPMDIVDEEGTEMIPVINGKWFKEMSTGDHMKNYDSLFVLTHFKGHGMGGFGGANKNLGIGCADGRIGKAMIHNNEKVFDVWNEELMEKITESCKATVDSFGKNITYVSVLRNMSVDCDCLGVKAEPVVTPNIGILASTDILAIDQAAIDLIYALPKKLGAHFIERVESRKGLRQLSYMKELGMGNDRYILIDVDTNEIITCKEAVKEAHAFVEGEC